jgi:hypothetical protein
MKSIVENDIWHWITNYIEVNHKFYDYKFPPCPYAKAARIKGLVKVTAYESGNVSDFISSEVNGILADKKFNVNVMVFPTRMRWFFHVHYFIHKLNRKIISQDYYLQYGSAVKTASQYPGILNGEPYFIVILNKLSDVLDGHRSLLKTQYYTPWAKRHYDDVVGRRERMYKNTQNKKSLLSRLTKDK